MIHLALWLVSLMLIVVIGGALLMVGGFAFLAVIPFLQRHRVFFCIIAVVIFFWCAIEFAPPH
jgi:hypothetical protein